MAQTAGNSFGQLIATVDNNGTITGSTGVALRGDVVTTSNGFTTSYAGFGSIANQAGGIIKGGIVGPAGTLTNAGLIEGRATGPVSIGNAGTSYSLMISSGA